MKIEIDLSIGRMIYKMMKLVHGFNWAFGLGLAFFISTIFGIILGDKYDLWTIINNSDSASAYLFAIWICIGIFVSIAFIAYYVIVFSDGYEGFYRKLRDKYDPYFCTVCGEKQSSRMDCMGCWMECWMERHRI